MNVSPGIGILHSLQCCVEKPFKFKNEFSMNLDFQRFFSEFQIFPLQL